MDILWFQLLSANAQDLLPQLMTSQLQTLSLLSQSAESHATINSIIFIAYIFVSLLIKRSSALVAFFVSWMIFELSFFEPLSEASLYLLTFSIYSYVITCNALTLKSRLACGILVILSITLAYDAYFYGIGGVYGEAETVVYNNIEHLALCAHSLFIGSFIPFARIRNNILSFIDSISHVTRNSAYIVIC